MRNSLIKSLIASASSGVLIAGLSLACASSARAADLTVAIQGMSERTGTLYWSLFDSAKDFEGDGPAVFAAQARVADGELRTTIHGLPAGRYAVKLFHDANNNGELDRNLVGIPTEGYGFSNNAGRRGPPRFEDAAVTVDDDLKIDIEVR
ncbi:MAG: DUF2141 domain-containing protein [Pseudomonadota bacterium]